MLNGTHFHAKSNLIIELTPMIYSTFVFFTSVCPWSVVGEWRKNASLALDE